MEKNQILIQNLKFVDYKDTETLRQFLNQNGKILPRKVTRIGLKHQKKIAQAVKRARFMGLLPFIER
jgi:small subunit ribosomal protein S18